MALKFEVEHRKLNFLFEAGTSRGVLNHKNTWLIKAYDDKNPAIFGIGEAGPLVGLSIDDIPDFDAKIKLVLNKVAGQLAPVTQNDAFEIAQIIPTEFPSVRFGLETALLDLVNGGEFKHFENDFYNQNKPLLINGLVWMGSNDLMLKRLKEKIGAGYNCIKIKIGAIGLEDELELIKEVRSQFSPNDVELRVDANGAFSFDEAPAVLNRLSQLEVHSIEQPIKAGKIEQMKDLCASTPIDIALDEELIGVHTYEEKQSLLNQIKPQYIILKPTLLGGFASSLEWIEIAEALNIGWWITSALESNIGLNAICQFASSLNVSIPQGLGTGGLYENNIDSPLQVIKDEISYNSAKAWGQVMK